MTRFMKFTKQIVTAMAFLSIAATSPTRQTANSIIGKWKDLEDPSKSAEITLAQDGYYYGRDTKGTIIMKKLQFDAQKKCFTGTMNPPDAKIELNVTITFESETKLKVVAKKFFISKTLYLTKQN